MRSLSGACVLSQQHFRALEAFFLGGPINRFFQPEIRIGAGESTVRMTVGEPFFHAAGAIHGAVYFKVLDDALIAGIHRSVAAFVPANGRPCLPV